MSVPERGCAPRLDRWFWLVVLLTLAVVLPRSLLISRAHSGTADEQFHLRRGLHYLTGEPRGFILPGNDAPLGQAVVALPMWVLGCVPENPIVPETMPDRGAAGVYGSDSPGSLFARAARRDVLFGHRIPPETLLLIIAGWKAILFVPFVALAFHWARSVYGLASGCLAAALLVVDPTFAAHVPIAALDVLAAEAVLLAAFLGWRYFESPSPPRLFAAAIGCAVAMMTKHVGLVVPVVFGAFAFLSARTRGERPRRAFNQLLLLGLIVAACIFVLTKFNFSPPADRVAPGVPGKEHGALHDLYYGLLQAPWPAGTFVANVTEGFRENAEGRWAYLLGQKRVGGWWYYYPAMALLKIPVGLWVVLLLGAASLAWVKPRRTELSLLIPLLLVLLLLMTARVNIGFRHFLPALTFIYLLAARCVSRPGPRVVARVAWLGVIGGFVQTTAVHPDYLSFVNYPGPKPWLAVADSGMDWGQSLRQTRGWLDKHPQGDRPVYIRYDFDIAWVDYWLRGRVRRLTPYEAVPTHGLLVLPPVWEVGLWDPLDTFARFRDALPIAVIGHSTPVYDLDIVNGAENASEGGSP